jgi:hypothetical protein
MFMIQRQVPAFLMAIGLMVAPACAAQRPYYGAQRDYRDVERRAYDDGYRRGLENGQRDARDRRELRVDRDRAYRDANNRDWSGDRDRFTRLFRDGYREGYTEGYNRIARNERPRVYPNGQTAGNPGNSRASSLAAQVGYRDGLDVGRNDAKDRESYDPRRSKSYREGDRDYNERYGSRDQYKQEYRAAFVQGYEEGYRGSRR